MAAEALIVEDAYQRGYAEVVANSVGFGESKAEAEARGQQLPENDGFMNIPEGADEELPFN